MNVVYEKAVNGSRMVVGQYVPYRYLCAGCCLRYGDPHPCGWVDLKRCDKCKPLSINPKGTNGKHGKNRG